MPFSWREYHEATKHSVESLSRARNVLDWANMPDAFRHYEGAALIDLPADPPAPGMSFQDVLGGLQAAPSLGGPSFLSSLLYYSAAISASKRVPSAGYTYALRVNPSSGNLHPTEFHFITNGLAGWDDGLYHYRPSSHMAEQRARGGFRVPCVEGCSLVFVLTSIAWREAWKYGSRAYRYCLHDIGHAWQALALAARALGCETFARGGFPDDELAALCRLNGDEWPMLLIGIKGAPRSAGPRDASGQTWCGGEPNELSRETIIYSLIEQIHTATKADIRGTVASARTGTGTIQLPAPAVSTRAFCEMVRARRSALDFVGRSQSMTLAQLAAILEAATGTLAADFGGARFIQLYLYAHRVDGLEPGVYRFWPEGGALELVRGGDQRVAAAGLSLGQDLAGNACIAFSMIGDLERATRAHGDRGYRYAHFEAGAIGHRLYLIAEALGLAATGIGAFYDDEVNQYLHLKSHDGQVAYHFAIGYPVPDIRLSA